MTEYVRTRLYIASRGKTVKNDRDWPKNSVDVVGKEWCSDIYRSEGASHASTNAGQRRGVGYNTSDPLTTDQSTPLPATAAAAAASK